MGKYNASSDHVILAVGFYDDHCKMLPDILPLFVLQRPIRVHEVQIFLSSSVIFSLLVYSLGCVPDPGEITLK